MMEHDAFLAAIISAPQDDAPRLIYADFLEEQGESERAEFIRVQCKRARLSDKHPPRYEEIDWGKIDAILASGKISTSTCDCNWCRLKRREEALLHKQMIRSIMQDGIRSTMSPVFRRGFIAEVTLSCQDWLTHRETLLRACPLEKVTLTKWSYGWYGRAPLYTPAPPYADKNYISPSFLGMDNGALECSVRDEKLWSRDAEVVVISLVEHGTLFGTGENLSMGTFDATYTRRR